MAMSEKGLLIFIEVVRKIEEPFNSCAREIIVLNSNFASPREDNS